MMTWQGVSNKQALRDWDAGESVWSCDMGGMGPGYEQCIQIMGFEMLRAMLKAKIDWKRAGKDTDYWQKVRDEIDKDPQVSAIIKKLGPSGAQHGAAMNIASVFARNGYSKGMKMVPEERRIQVSRTFPTLDCKVA